MNFFLNSYVLLLILENIFFHAEYILYKVSKNQSAPISLSSKKILLSGLKPNLGEEYFYYPVLKIKPVEFS